LLVAISQLHFRTGRSHSERPSDLQREKESNLQHHQHSLSQIAENRAQKFAEYRQNCISPLSKERKLSPADAGLAGDLQKEGKSKLRERQHTPSQLAENRAQKFAEYRQTYILPLSKE
jgi:hypothetical protein